MSPYHIFIFRTVVTLIAASVVILIALFLLRTVFRGGKWILGIIFRLVAFVVCIWLVSLAGRGDVGEWGAWVGVGGAVVLIGPILFRVTLMRPGRSPHSRRAHSRL